MIKPKHEDMTPKIWQVKAGDGGRDYWDVFLRFGVMLIGPGTKYGDYRLKQNKKAYRKYYGAKKCRPLDQFEKADEGDLVVLKCPKGETKWAAVAVGKITSEYDFKSVFGDVEGFQLQHCRQVDWRRTSDEPILGLGRGGGYFCRVIDERARKAVNKKWDNGKEPEFDPIPPDPEIVSDEELVDFLAVTDCGRRNAKLIADAVLRLRRLANWYENNDDNYDVKEHEARTFLVVPLIMSLGWAEENVKIEWKHKDIALFDTPYSRGDEPIVIIETKQLWDGLGDATKQAKKYAGPYKNCKKFVVTDGIRYKLYKRPKYGKEWPLTAYLNLLTPTCNHPYEPRVGGAVSFLSKMFQRRQSNRRV